MGFWKLDWNTLRQVGIAAASVATLAFTYFTSKNGGQVPALNLSQEEMQLIAQGAIMGALHTDNIDNIMYCAMNPTNQLDAIKDDLELAVGAFSKENVGISDIVNGVQGLGRSFEKLGGAVKECDQKLHNSREMEIFLEMTEKFTKTSAGDLVFEIGNNMYVHGVDIYRELSAAYTNYYAKEYEMFGRDIGSALALSFIGPAGSAKLSNEDAAALKSMAEAQLYPTLSAGIYNDDDNKKWIEYLDYLSLSRSNPEGIFTKPDIADEDKFAMPAKREVTPEEI